HGHPANEGKETNWWFRKWCDPVGEHTETSGVDPNKRPYPIDGTWERYTFKVGNIRFLMMGDRNDLPYPVGRRASGGASPAGAVTPETAPLHLRAHSITSSARSKNDSGIVSPSALAVVRLMTRSNLVGCSIGMSPGFAPRRILST